mgnify:CR=1 FL=1
MQLDLLAIQETHIACSDIGQLSELGFDTIIASKQTCKTRGTALMAGRQMDNLSVCRKNTDASGRWAVTYVTFF